MVAFLLQLLSSMASGLSRIEIVTAACSELGKPKWILEVKLLVKKSDPHRTISPVYLLLKERKRKRGRVPEN